jgi:hypothetical protein
MKLYVTHCGEKKNPGILAPQEMYKSPRIQRFVKWCESHSYPWAILSAKYGLFFPDERKPDYNVTINRRQQNSDYFLNIRVKKDGKLLGREESKSHIVTLARDIRDQLRAKEIGQVIFCIEGRCPDAYIAVLHYGADECDSLPAGHANLEPHLQICTRAGRMKLARDCK